MPYLSILRLWFLAPGASACLPRICLMLILQYYTNGNEHLVLFPDKGLRQVPSCPWCYTDWSKEILSLYIESLTACVIDLSKLGRLFQLVSAPTSAGPHSELYISDTECIIMKHSLLSNWQQLWELVDIPYPSRKIFRSLPMCSISVSGSAIAGCEA